MYKITATIIKPGNPPVSWIKYSKQKMTKEQCEKLFSMEKEVGRTLASRVSLAGFDCTKINSCKA